MRSYPVYAQQLYAKPRSKDGTIVCANCHLVSNSVGVGGRKVVGYDDALFVGVRLAGYDNSAEVANPRGLGGVAQGREWSSLRGAAEGALGGVVVLPEGFKVLPKERLSGEVQSTVKGLFVQPWGLGGGQGSGFSAFVVGPVKGVTRPLGTPHFPSGRDLLFPILTPQSDQEEGGLYFGCCPVYVGAVRGRGQVYPSGVKSSANGFEPLTGGKVVAVAPQRGRLVKVLVERGAVGRDSSGSSGLREVRSFGGGLVVKIDETLSGGGKSVMLVGSNNGGFGQGATYVYLQGVNRVQFASGIGILGGISQVFLVSKKKQFEKVQGAERIF
jgi:apocytochrome f